MEATGSTEQHLNQLLLFIHWFRGHPPPPRASFLPSQRLNRYRSEATTEVGEVLGGRGMGAVMRDPRAMQSVREASKRRPPDWGWERQVSLH